MGWVGRHEGRKGVGGEVEGGKEGGREEGEGGWEKESESKGRMKGQTAEGGRGVIDAIVLNFIASDEIKQSSMMQNGLSAECITLAAIYRCRQRCH